MTETSELLESLAKLRESLGERKSHMEIIRDLVSREAGRSGTPELHSLLTDSQREFMTTNIDRIQEFLSTSDGADAFELLMGAFKEYVATMV